MKEKIKKIVEQELSKVISYGAASDIKNISISDPIGISIIKSVVKKLNIDNAKNQKDLLISFAEFVKKDNDCVTHEQQADTFISSL